MWRGENHAGGNRMPRPKNPFRKVGAAKKIRTEDAVSATYEPTRSGAADRTPRVPAAFDPREQASAIDDPLITDAMTRRFLYGHIERKTSIDGVLESAGKSSVRAPSTRNLERMRSVVNEMGRRRGGGRKLRSTLTQELVDEIIDGSNPT